MPVHNTSLGGGGVSFVEGVQGGFTIANGVDIENASGGSGNDVIFGNTVENVLSGNGGNDQIFSASNGSGDNTIDGGAGNDTIYVADSSGADTVTGGSGNDIAVVTSNSGSFSGGIGTDTLRFVGGIQNFLLEVVDGVSQFFNVVTRYVFSMSDDVEFVEFSDGSLRYNPTELTAAMQVSDIDTTGTVLQHANHGVYFLGGSDAKIVLFVDDQVVGENHFSDWNAVQAEAEGSGYRVLWQHDDGGFAEWTVNDQGRFVGSETLDNVVNVEEFYGVDLNDDGTIGHVTSTIEDDGSTTLGLSTMSLAQGSYVIDGGVRVTSNGEPIGPESFEGWSLLHAESDGSGYRILWQDPEGEFFEWVLNDQGERQSGYAIENVVDVEAFYGADIDDSGFVGAAPERTVVASAVKREATNDASVQEPDDTEFHFVFDDGGQADEADATDLTLVADQSAGGEQDDGDRQDEQEEDQADSIGDFASVLESDFLLL